MESSNFLQTRVSLRKLDFHSNVTAAMLLLLLTLLLLLWWRCCCRVMQAMRVRPRLPSIYSHSPHFYIASTRIWVLACVLLLAGVLVRACVWVRAFVCVTACRWVSACVCWQKRESERMCVMRCIEAIQVNINWSPNLTGRGSPPNYRQVYFCSARSFDETEGPKNRFF